MLRSVPKHLLVASLVSATFYLAYPAISQTVFPVIHIKKSEKDSGGSQDTVIDAIIQSFGSRVFAECSNYDCIDATDMCYTDNSDESITVNDTPNSGTTTVMQIVDNSVPSPVLTFTPSSVSNTSVFTFTFHTPSVAVGDELTIPVQYQTDGTAFENFDDYNNHIYVDHANTAPTVVVTPSTATVAGGGSQAVNAHVSDVESDTVNVTFTLLQGAATIQTATVTGVSTTPSGVDVPHTFTNIPGGASYTWTATAVETNTHTAICSVTSPIAQNDLTTVSSVNTITSTGSSSAPAQNNSSSSSGNDPPTCTAPTPQNIPNIVVGKVVDNKVKINWVPVVGADKVSIRYTDTSGNWKYSALNISDSGSYTINDLQANTPYYFSIAAISGCAIGGWTDPINQAVGLPDTGRAGTTTAFPFLFLFGTSGTLALGLTSFMIHREKKHA